MNLVRLGSAQDYIDAANHGYAVTSSTSQKILNAFNAQGGNTPLASSTVASKSEPGFFDKLWGIFDKLDTLATPTPKAPIVLPSAPGPSLAVIGGIGVVAFLLLKSVKG